MFLIFLSGVFVGSIVSFFTYALMAAGADEEEWERRIDR